MYALNPNTLNLVNEVQGMLNKLHAPTQIMVINMLAYSKFPIEGHDEASQIISALISVVNGADDSNQNPIIVASKTVCEIWALVHGQAQHYARTHHLHIEDAVDAITAELLETLQEMPLAS